MVGRQGAITGNPGSADRGSLRLDNPLVVQWEYASEERLAARNAAYRQLIEGVDAETAAFDAVAERRPRRVLEVGCGMGEFAERVQDELGAEVIAVDLSSRMVELSRQRGLDARVGDIEHLEFEDASFDCVVANWVLYHVPDLERGLAEIVRVLEPGGRLVAGTLGDGNLREVWELLGEHAVSRSKFWSENGEEILARHFARVERRDALGTVVFPDPEALRSFVAVTITRAHLADRVPKFDGPFRARSAHCVFVAEKKR